jgi:hypothetical protein
LNAVWVKIIGSVVTMLAGGTVAAVTVVGLISSQVDSAGDHPGNASSSTIDYGSSR